MPEPAKKFYLTTPIYYVNARPHIGHAYTTIAADVIARRHRLLGEDTFFLTGTDEHGQKVQRSAAAARIPPQQFTDEVSASFRNLWKRMGLTNDDYIRTTEPRHHRGVQHLWRQLEANGAIYLSSYTGAYCVSDEAFVDLPAGTPCPDCGRPLETVTEENYFFRLSDYQQPLIDLIESGTLHIQPDTARNEVLSFLRGGLKDLSISRTTFDWGIPVPGNPKHVVYVWLDALANYITAIGYGSDEPADQAKFALYWPADLHLVGKEITRFHCVYWPAILLASGLPLPKSIVANGWLLFEESKMSKSRGNVVRTETILDAFGPLCPPVPSPHAIASGPLDSTGLQPGESGGNNVGALAPGTTSAAPGLSGGSRGLQSPESTPHAEISGAPSMTGSHPGMGGNVIPSPAESPILAPPTKTQQDIFAADGTSASQSSSALLKDTASEPVLSEVERMPPNAPFESPALAADGTSASPGLSGGSRGLQPPESTPKDERALAPGLLTPPTKAQQDLFAADVLRYFLLREIPFGQDGTFSFDALITRYNADLANGYGNLVSRTLSMVGQIPKPLKRAVGELPDLAQNYLFSYISGPGKFAFANDRDKEHYQLRFSAGSLENGIRGAFENYDLTRVTENISWAISGTDSHLSSNTPWKMPDGAERDDVIYTAAESIRIITALLYPILPYATASVWQQLGLGSIEQAARDGVLKDLKWGGLKPGTKLGPLAPIFPRADKGLAQIMTDMENPTTPETTTDAPAEASVPTPEALNAVHPTTEAASATPTDTLQPATENSPLISIDDFAKVELRVAQIVVAERIPKADKLLRLEVDLGPNFNPSRRQILAGIAEHYTPESLIGRKVVIVANLAPRKMRGLESQGMVVAASISPAGAPVLAGFLEDVELGARLK